MSGEKVSGAKGLWCNRCLVYKVFGPKVALV